MLAEGVHFLPDDPPGDIAYKLVAVNLSDLAAMGARPIGVLLGVAFAVQSDVWIEAFATGLGQACARWEIALLGGDTIGGVERLVLGLTALGQVAPGAAIGRAGAQVGDALWVTGNIGDAGLGLAVARGDRPPDAELLARYRRPEPQVAFGMALVGLATAAIDVSDGLLIDAGRVADASSVATTIELARLPRSRAAEAAGTDPLALATSGDDYQLLFTAAAARGGEVEALGRRLKTRVTRIGHVAAGAGLSTLGQDGAPVEPARLGWEHGTQPAS